MQQAVIFTSTQRDADELAAHLYEMGHAVAPLHGGMPQGRRNRTLMALRRGELRILVATDVAARGIDVPTISHVINFGLPMKAEDYVHRIGRTGRAGRSGRAITLAERRDVGMIRRIQQFTTQSIPVGTLAGLEPKRPAPEMFSRAPRRDGGRPPHRGHGGPGGYGGRPDNRGGDRGGYGFARPMDGAPRRGGFDGPRFDSAPRFDAAPRFEAPRHEGRPEFRGEPRHDGPRGQGPRRQEGAPRFDGERRFDDRSGPRGGFGGGRPAPRGRGHGPR
ncbi:helicase-related protein [Sphaerotilus sulfidivorans]